MPILQKETGNYNFHYLALHIILTIQLHQLLSLAYGVLRNAAVGPEIRALEVLDGEGQPELVAVDRFLLQH